MGYTTNGVINAIYDMAIGQSTWDDILDIMAAQLPDCCIVVSGDDLATGRNLVYAQRGLLPASAPAYIEVYARANPLREGLADFAPGQVYRDTQICSRDEILASRFYREWLNPQGEFGGEVGMVLLREGTRQLVLSVRYPLSEEAALRDRVLGLLGEAAGHFDRAFEISSRIRFSNGHSYIDGIVEDLPYPVFFVRQDMRIQYSNFHAQALRRHNQGPISTVDGLLRATDPQSDQALRKLVEKTAALRRLPAAVIQLASRTAPERCLAVARLASRGIEPYQLHDAILDPGPLVMVVVHSDAEIAHLPADLLWRTFALTEAEATLAEALLKGETLGDFAKQREVSKQTLRNQLVSVMRKTRTKRQSELVSLLTRLSLTCF